MEGTRRPDAPPSLRDNLTRVLRNVRSTHPDARIIILGYPYLFPAGDAWMWNPDCVSVLRRVDKDKRDELRLMQNALNNLIYQVAEEVQPTKVEFISTVAAWHEHEPCGGEGQFTNAVRPAWQLLNPIDGATFHPNSSGHKQLARLIACYLNEYTERPERVDDATTTAPIGSALPETIGDDQLPCSSMLARATEPLATPDSEG